MQKDRVTVRMYLIIGVVLILFAWIVNNMPAIGSILSQIMGVLSPFLIGAFIAYLLYRPVNALETILSKIRFLKKCRMGLRRSIAVLVVYALAIGAVVLLICYTLPQMARSLGLLVTKVQPTANVVSVWITDLMKNLNIPQSDIASVFSSWQSIIATVVSSIGNIAAGAYQLTIAFLSGTFNLGLGIIISIYILFGKELLITQFKKGLYAFAKTETADTICSITRRSNQIFSIFLYVRILCSLAVGVITYLILAPFGFNFVVLISVIAGVFNLIPIFGPIIAIILNSLLLLIANPAQVIWYIILAIVMQQIEGNLVEPKLMGDRMGLPVLWVLFGVLAGGGFFGILGMLIGVPLLAIIYSLMQALIESRLQKKQLDIF
jgi:predicted PurR-regulated permease PerM